MANGTTRRDLLDRLSQQLNYPAELPIVDRREELVAAIADNQVLIVAGETVVFISSGCLLIAPHNTAHMKQFSTPP